VAKIQIPEALKADLPPTLFGRILSATPVVMTVIATMLAGLASSEMTKAQYDRSLAAQQQSKAGDQWNFFQAKKLRSAYQHGNLDNLQLTHALRQVDPAELKAACSPSTDADKVAEILSLPANQSAFVFLQRGELPLTAGAPSLSPEIKATYAAIESLKPDAEIASLIGKVSPDQINESIHSAKDHVDAFDAATKPINQLIESLDTIIARQAPSQAKADFVAARLRFAALRYEAEAKLNQSLANLYELQVRKNNISAERHHLRSKRFFFGMLGAQMAVIISTFAMAARKRNLLWGMAAIAGITALVFAAYVYLRV
jgi:uncharacterized membrane protein